MTDKHIDTTIAPDVQLRKTLTSTYIEYVEAYSEIDTQLRVFGDTNPRTINRYTNATIKAISMILPFLQKAKFKNIKLKVSQYQLVNWEYLVQNRIQIKEHIEKAYYLSGIIEIDQSQQIRIYDIDSELRQIVNEFLEEKLVRGGKQ
jgi:hypothetical protein